MNNNNQLIEDILDLDNLSLAVQRVKSNKGSAGVDGMTTKELVKFTNTEGFHELIQSVRNGTYKPKPVRIVEIPKPDRGIRMLGIPTVIDRVIQQAISQVL